ncbi:MAG: tetratricopeptide repeat protein [bacterium]
MVTVADALHHAERLQANHQLKEAEALYKQLLQQVDNNPAIYGGIASLAMRVYKYDQAQTQLDKAKSLVNDKNNLGLLIQQVELWLLKGLFHKAYQSASIYLDDLPHPRLFLRAAQAASALGRFKEAEVWLDHTLTINPDDLVLRAERYLLEIIKPNFNEIDSPLPKELNDIAPFVAGSDFQLLMARIHLELGHFEISEAWLEGLLDIPFPLLMAQLLKARIDALTNKQAQAEKAFNQVIAVYRRNPLAYAWLGELFVSLDRYGDAMYCFAHATEWQRGLHKSWYLLANLLHTKKHKSDKAARAYEKVFEIDSSNINTFLLLCLTLIESEQHEQVQSLLKVWDASLASHANAAQHARVFAYRAFLALKNNNIEQAYRDIHDGNQQLASEVYLRYVKALLLLLKKKELKRAEGWLQQVVGKAPNPTGYLFDLARVQSFNKKNKRAIKTLQNLIERRPGYVDAREMLFELYFIEKKMAQAKEQESWIIEHATDRAEAIVEKRLKANPNDALAHVHYARVLRKRTNALDEAIKHCDKALSLKPKYYRALILKGEILGEQERIKEAEKCYLAAIESEPNMTAAFVRLTQNLLLQDRCYDAKSYADQAALLKKDMPTCLALASVMERLGNIDKALSLYDEAIALAPESPTPKWNKSLLLLNTGRISEGMELYDYGFDAGPRRPYRKFKVPQWQGESLKGKRLLVWREQGIGDEIYEFRFLHDLIKLGGRYIFEVSPRLKSIVKRTFPDVDVVSADPADDLTRKDIDYHLPLISIRRYIPQDYSVPAVYRAYLTPDPEQVEKWRRRLGSLGDGLKIGFSWRSGLQNLARNKAYSEIEEWRSLFNLKNVHIINLMYSECQNELDLVHEEFDREIHVWDDLDLKNDLDQVFALISNLDLVIAPSSTPGDMAQVMGIPSWIVKNDPLLRKFKQPTLSKRRYPGQVYQRFYDEDVYEFKERVVSDINKYMNKLRG